MKFIKPFGDYRWYEWDIDAGKAYNYDAGFIYLDENKMSGAIFIEAEDWHDLTIKTGYNPLICSFDEKYAWLSPSGCFYKANSHEVAAQDITELVFGNRTAMVYADDYLVQKGWLKLTTSLMWEIYLDTPDKWYLTNEQVRALKNWCKYHNIEYPKDKIIVTDYYF